MTPIHSSIYPYIHPSVRQNKEFCESKKVHPRGCFWNYYFFSTT